MHHCIRQSRLTSAAPDTSDKFPAAGRRRPPSAAEAADLRPRIPPSGGRLFSPLHYGVPGGPVAAVAVPVAAADGHLLRRDGGAVAALSGGASRRRRQQQQQQQRGRNAADHRARR